MQVIYRKKYIERDIFLIEYRGKALMVYRSSGLSKTGHNGEIIPFLYLEERDKLYTKLGHLFKEFPYKGKILQHKKELYAYPKVKKLMEDIQEFVKDIELKYDPVEDSIFNKKRDDRFELFIDYIKSINTEMKEILKKNQLDLFDYSDL